MPIATLLHRGFTSASLKSIVEKAHRVQIATHEYELDIKSTQLCLKQTTTTTTIITALQKQTSADEGFESDIDSISLISSDETDNCAQIKAQETDSANGSACSDSDDTESGCTKFNAYKSPSKSCEIFNLVDCICYTDTKYPDTLVFVIKSEALVFKFNNLDALRTFYGNFSTLKAVANQKVYNNTPKFNLLHRTDVNGVMHIEISRQNNQFINNFNDDSEPTSIISLNTPDSFVKSYNNTIKSRECVSLNEKKFYKTIGVKKAVSIENLLDFNELKEKTQSKGDLRKVWSSAENLLEAPKRPERRKHQKGPAPLPPTQQNILKGHFVRVNVLKADQSTKLLPPKPPIPIKPNFMQEQMQKPQFFKFTETKKDSSWTNSMPRLLRKPRSKSETRLFTPMAYRYIDTTQSQQPITPPNNAYQPRFQQNPQKKPISNSHTISNRLFGMSSKLKEFQSLQSNCNVNNKFNEGKSDLRYSSLGNLSYKINNTDGSLKSVIKNGENRRKNDKKVTFSAYNTVQVV